jgi:hypothetical protein
VCGRKGWLQQSYLKVEQASMLPKRQGPKSCSTKHFSILFNNFSERDFGVRGVRQLKC